MTRGTEGEIVPLRDRLQQLHFFRLLVLFGLLVGLAVGPLTTPVVGSTVASVVGYGVATSLGMVAWIRPQGRKLPLLGILLLTDGAFLFAVRILISDPDGVLILLPILHVVVVALLGSYSTGWKISVWHTLLFFIGQEMAAAQLFPGLALEERSVLAPIVVMWGAMLLTSAASGLNERELRRQRHDLAALALFSQHVQGCDEPSAVVAALHEALAAETEGQVIIYDPAAELVALGPGAGEEHPVEQATVLADLGEDGSTVLIEGLDPSRDGWLAALLPDAQNIAILSGPRKGAAGLVAVVTDLASPGSRVQRRVVAAMERTMSYGSLAYGNATLRADLAARAATDGLTGIANRATFDSRLVLELERTGRTHAHVSLLLLDIDRFKRFNDTHGHLAGDEAIRLVAATLSGQGRPYDLVARYGGEEFAAVLPNTTLAEAPQIAERFRAAVAAIDGAAAPLSVSIGVASSELSPTPESLVQAADEALYAAKDAGRDTVRVARQSAEGGRPEHATPTRSG